MSHYAVAVFTEEGGLGVDELLGPYYEGIEVEPYVYMTKAQIIEHERERIERNMEMYQEYLRSPEQFSEKYGRGTARYYADKFPKLLEMSAEELHRQYFGETDMMNEDGDYLTAYNPDSKWDWYSIGGRWGDELILKGEKDACEDCARVSEIDFDEMRRKRLADLTPYAEALEHTFYKKEYFLSRWPDEESYIRSMTEFTTFAVLTPDGLWHEPGRMGWFGCSTSSADEEIDWELNYAERFLKPALENGWELTIVDCHI